MTHPMSGHTHYDYADRGHGHGELESLVAGLREDLSRAEARIYELEQTVEAHRENDPHLYADGSAS